MSEPLSEPAKEKPTGVPVLDTEPPEDPAEFLAITPGDNLPFAAQFDKDLWRMSFPRAMFAQTHGKKL
jgi:hypothetical protein